MQKTWPKALYLGIASSLFFSVTYIVNSVMARSGGNWIWSASLRYLLMLPILFALTAKQGWKPIFREIRRDPWRWILWSTVGYGIFYAPTTLAAAYGPGWMVAGVFQLTIVAGALETPLFRDEEGRRQKIPMKLFPAFGIILLGVFLLQLEQMKADKNLGNALLFAIPVVVSAIAYPLGNRKTMAICQTPLTTAQRMLAMDICSLPFWLAISAVACFRTGLPSVSQVANSAIVAVFSGTLGTLMFYDGTAMVRDHPQRIALVESTQCGELIFSFLGGIVLLGDALPGAAGWLGLVLIVAGMIVNSILTIKTKIS